MKGTRACIGAILQERSDPWLNACPTAWTVVTGDNGDIKLPLRLPILKETHEGKLQDVCHCCENSDPMEMAFPMKQMIL